ncbi:MAG: YceI family protein [Acidimicrobiia bacterium]
MRRSVIGWIAAAVIAVGGAALAYVLFFAGGSGEPSTDLTTPDVITEATTTSMPSDSATTTSVASDPSTTTDPGTAGGPGQYVIDPAQSQASFQIDETLRGSPNTVVGTTSEVAGQILIDSNDLGASRFSPIVINARTLTTDSDQRNRVMRSPVILDSGSDENELVTFTPASLDGLGGVTATVGESLDFEVTGDLIIKGMTQTVTFSVSAVLADESTIQGTATTRVLRSDFGIGIPNVPFVADVADEVTLTLEFVAVSG